MSDSQLTLQDTEENYGKKLYQTNSNYRNIVNVMEHPEFRKFFGTHFQNLSTTKTILMFMKLYEAIEKKSKIPLNGYQKIAIVDQIIKNRQIRQEIVKGLCDNSTSLSDDMNRMCIE